MRAKRFVASSLARTLETVIAIFTGLIMMPLMIRILGEDLYGIWIVIGSIVGSLYLFDIGMASSVTRYVSYALSRNDRQRASQIMSTAFAMYSGLALLIVLTTAVIALSATLFVESPENTRLVQILILIVGLNVAVEFPFKSYAGIAGYHLRQDLLSYSRIAFKIVSTLIIAWLLFQGYQLIAIALVQLASSFFSNLVFRFIARYLEPEVRLQPRLINKPTVKEIFGFSAWSFLVDLSRLLKERGDVWMVAAFTTPALLTVYYVGVRLVEYANELLYKAFGFTLPLYTEAVAREDDAELARKVRMFLRLNAIVAGGMLIGAYLFGNDLIRLWMGSDFNSGDAYRVLVVLLSAKLLVFITAPYSNVLFAIAKHQYQAYVSAAEAACSLALIPILIQLMDNPLLAASIAIALPFVLTRPFIIPHLVSRYSKLPVTLLYQTVLPLIAKVSVFGLVWYLGLGFSGGQWGLVEFFLVTGTYGCSYAVFAYLLLLSGNERNLLRSGIGLQKLPRN